jgi:hypothetical protein
MYAKTNGATIIAFPYGHRELQQENPNRSLPSDLSVVASELGLVWVAPTPPPAFDSTTHRARQVAPSLGSNGYEEAWELVPLPLEQAQANVRSLRGQKLAATDWTQTIDSPVDRDAWAQYRQALRDIPSQEGFPYNVSWPTSP